MAMTAADRIEEISPTVILVFVMVAAAIFQAVDILIPRIGMGPLYLILVGLVAWRLGPRVSIVATIVAIALSMPSAVHSGGPASPAIMTIRVAIRCGVLAFVFMTMKALRRAYDRERAAARLDGMTGLLNKASFGVEMDRILSAGSKPLVVGSIDLDHFKQVNDDHGHAAGDRAIRAVATAATSIVGKDGHVGRIGGDEFAFVRRVDSVENGRGPGAGHPSRSEPSAGRDRLADDRQHGGGREACRRPHASPHLDDPERASKERYGFEEFSELFDERL